MSKQKITGIVSGGLMGSDPFDASTWSGSARSLFNELKSVRKLESAFGANISRLEYALRLLPVFYPNKQVWQRRLMMNVAYRNRLTASLLHRSRSSIPTNILQLGAYCNSKEVFPNAKLFTYQDGNVLQRFQSKQLPIALAKDKKLFDAVFNYEKKLANDADLVLTTSEFLRDSFISDYKIAKDKVINVDIGTNLTEFKDAVLAKKDYDSPDLLLIGKGGFEVKGVDIAIKAFSNVLYKKPNAKLHIIGQKNIPSEFKSIPNVFCYGILNKQNSADSKIFERLFSKSSIFILPSRFEPFGIAPIEAMIHGIPPIITGKWALKQTVTDNVTGLHAKEGDVDDWSEKMLYLLNNPTLCEALGKRAREQVMVKFNWKNVVSNIVNLFETCVT